MAPGEEVKALAAASPSAKAAESIIAPAVGGSAGGLGDGLGGGISASKFIALPGNAGPKSTLISLPIERSSDDSDEDETGGSASSMDHEVVSKRNQSMMNKHKLKIQRSTGPDGTGNGLFTAAALEAKTVLPIKGIWFETLGELNDWLASLSTMSATQFAKKVIKVNFSQGSDMDKKVVRYFVMTSLTGFVQSFCGISQRANAKILFDPDRPLGQYSLKIELLQRLAEDREILISKGADYANKEKKKGAKALKSEAKGHGGG